jgi:hypothetical protein
MNPLVVISLIAAAAGKIADLIRFLVKRSDEQEEETEEKEGEDLP